MEAKTAAAVRELRRLKPDSPVLRFFNNCEHPPERLEARDGLPLDQSRCADCGTIVPSPAPTPNERAGIVWWNGLRECERAYWLRRSAERVGTPNASVATAWDEYQRVRAADAETAAAPAELGRALTLADEQGDA